VFVWLGVCATTSMASTNNVAFKNISFLKLCSTLSPPPSSPFQVVVHGFWCFFGTLQGIYIILGLMMDYLDWKPRNNNIA
jgi:hypothetical protein